MITQDNLKEVLKKISDDDISKVYNSSCEDIIVRVNLFNAGYTVDMLSSGTLTEENLQEEIDNGAVCFDKESLNDFFQEFNIDKEV